MDRENRKAKKTKGRTRGENTEKIQRGERTRKKPVEGEGDEEENKENKKNRKERRRSRRREEGIRESQQEVRSIFVRNVPRVSVLSSPALNSIHLALLP